jgi:hypothetical protein
MTYAWSDRSRGGEAPPGCRSVLCHGCHDAVTTPTPVASALSGLTLPRVEFDCCWDPSWRPLLVTADHLQGAGARASGLARVPTRREPRATPADIAPARSRARQAAFTKVPERRRSWSPLPMPDRSVTERDHHDARTLATRRDQRGQRDRKVRDAYARGTI